MTAPWDCRETGPLAGQFPFITTPGDSPFMGQSPLSQAPGDLPGSCVWVTGLYPFSTASCRRRRGSAVKPVILRKYSQCGIRNRQPGNWQLTTGNCFSPLIG